VGLVSQRAPPISWRHWSRWSVPCSSSSGCQIRACHQISLLIGGRPRDHPYEEGNGAYTLTARSQKERPDSDFGDERLGSDGPSDQETESAVKRPAARSWATFTVGELTSDAVGTVRRCRLSGLMDRFRPECPSCEAAEMRALGDRREERGAWGVSRSSRRRRCQTRRWQWSRSRHFNTGLLPMPSSEVPLRVHLLGSCQIEVAGEEVAAGCASSSGKSWCGSVAGPDGATPDAVVDAR
jgi:hypothetical protein